ncbi:hypothetical protein PENTCL1PPCAC_9397, partial [Pristionchus entomophagus]
ARGSSSRESLVAKRDAAAAAGASVLQPVCPVPAAAASRRASHGVISPLPASSILTPPSSAVNPAMTHVSMKTSGSSTAHFGSSPNGGGHYPRQGSLYGPPVHQHQSMLPAPPSSLYPARLSAALLRTIYHPAWLRPKRMGEDEKSAIDRCGHTHLMLPARIHRTSTMVEKCLKALKETSMPLPPLQPLLPAPCQLLQHESCDPLIDVLDSVPQISADHFHFRSHRVAQPAQPTYSMANEGLRHHMMMTQHLAVENEDWNKKWWEVRTFPSFGGLSTSSSRAPLPTSRPDLGTVTRDDGTVTPNGGIVTYSSAYHGTRRHAMKYTYVTSKKPIFSVAEPSPAPCYSTPHNTPVSVITISSSAEAPTTQHRRPAVPRRPGVAAARSALAAAQRKRPAAQTDPGAADALAKRTKTSFAETCPGRPADHRPMSQQLQLQSEQLMQQAMQAVQQGYCIPEAPANNNAIPTRTARQEEITVDQDGTTFTVL